MKHHINPILPGTPTGFCRSLSPVLVRLLGGNGNGLSRRHSLRLAVFLALACGCLGAWGAGERTQSAEQEVGDALRELRKTIAKGTELAERKQQRLLRLAASMEGEPAAKKCQTAIELADDYRTFNADSSVHYANHACRIADRTGSPELRQAAILTKIKSLSTLGIFSEAKALFHDIDPREIPDDLKPDYYFTGRTLYGYIVGYLNDTSEFATQARERYRQYDDSLLSILPESSELRQFILGEKLTGQGRNREAVSLNRRLLERLEGDPDNEHLYAMVAFQLAMSYAQQGERQLMGLYLAKAARADIRICARDGLALPLLANWLYKEGKLDLAYEFINVALDEATLGGIRWRAFAMAAIVPSIDDAYRRQVSASKRQLILFVSITTLALAVSIAMLFVFFRQRRKAHRAAARLASTSKLQDAYIGNLLAMCSTYGERLNQLSSMVERKLASGQVEELKKMVRSGRLAENQDDDFYRILDSAFLELYPDFVPSLNALLKPDCQIAWTPGQSLTPELRIYALVRLGITESQRLAQTLHYSISTVYAYRNRMRNRAIERERFDSDVMAIGSHSDHTLEGGAQM